MGNYRNFKLVYYFVAQGTARAEKEKLEKDIGFFENRRHKPAIRKNTGALQCGFCQRHQ